jgi:hypothetical protein
MEILSSVLGWFDSFPAWFAAISGVVTAATAIAILTPTPADDNFLAKVRKFIDFLAGNFGHNK